MTGWRGRGTRAIEAAAAELIAFLDSDDIWLPGKLEASASDAARSAEKTSPAPTGSRDSSSPPGAEPPRDSGRNARRRASGADAGSAPGSPRGLRQVGVFDPSYLVALDVDWFLRLQDTGHLLELIPQLMLEKRFHAGNLSHSQPARYKREMTMAARGSVARRRGAA